jgi:predicted CXXCH cytochrome family protein
MLKKNTRSIRGLSGALSVSALALGLGISASAVAGGPNPTGVIAGGTVIPVGSGTGSAPNAPAAIGNAGSIAGAAAGGSIPSFGVSGVGIGAQAVGATVQYNNGSGGNNAAYNGSGPAAGPYAPAQSINITYSRHNLGSQNKIGSNHTSNVLATNTSGADNAVVGTNQICVFCHTPHGFNTVQSGPLWNKQVNASSTYTVYNAGSNSSSTLDADAPVLGSVSLACLSCHDGTQAMDNMINGPGSGGMAQPYDGSASSSVSAGSSALSNAGVSQGYIWGGAGGAGSVTGFAFMSQNGTGFNTSGTGSITNDTPALEGIDLGTDLSNDHPISVQYCGGGIPINSGSQVGATSNGAGVTGGAAVVADGTCRDRLFNLPTVRVISGQPEFWIDTNLILDTDAILAGAASTGGSGAYPITRDPATIEFYVTDGTTSAMQNPNSVLMSSNSMVVQAGSCGVGVNGDACGRGFISLVSAAAGSAVSAVQPGFNVTIYPGDQALAGGFGVRTKQDLILFTNNTGVVNSPSVECASCHDPHTPNNGTFLRVSNAGSGLCLSCHVK